MEGASNVNLMVAPLPVMEPGLMVHPAAGRPLKSTLPVAVVQFGWVIVPTTGGAILQYNTELSVLVLTELTLPATSVIVPLPKPGIIVPLPEAVINAVQVILFNVVKLETESPVAVPPSVRSSLINVVGLIGSLNSMVNETGDVEVGSVCEPLWLIVTVGAFASMGSADWEMAVVKGALLPAKEVRTILTGILLPAATSVPPEVTVNVAV